jgi:hypothetical protein
VLQGSVLAEPRDGMRNMVHMRSSVDVRQENGSQFESSH